MYIVKINLLKYRNLLFVKLTIYEIIKASNDKMLATSLSSAAVWVEIYMAYWLPRSEPTNNQGFPIRMNDIYIGCIAFVKPNGGLVPLKQWSCRIKT